MPEAQSPEDASRHPPERRLKPVPCPALVYRICRRNLRNTERYPMRVFKEMSGPPKFCLIRTTRTNAGSPTGRESYGDGGLVVVAGVTTCQGGRESRPQGEGGQVTGHHKQPGGMRNACDMRSHVVSESVDWRSTDVDSVTSGQCSRPVPTVTCVAGDGWVRSSRESQGPLLRPGVTGEGKAGHGVTSRKPSRMPRQHDCSGRVVMPGRQGLCRCDAAGGGRGAFAAVWTPPSPGYRGQCDTRSQVVSGLCVRRFG